MTGFGSARIENEQMTVTVDIKTLNSKYLDTIIKLPNIYSNKEIEIKKSIGDRLKRGKATLIVNYESKSPISQMKVNQTVVENYYKELKQTADHLTANDADIFRIVMNMPEAISSNSDKNIVEQDWKVVQEAIIQAIDACNEFREQEGKALEKELESYIRSIAELLVKVEQRDPERVKYIKEKLNRQVAEFVNSEQFDENRFEQELIYYIEKLDISEEKVRLKNHLAYFIQSLETNNSNGKKLGFISQEIGREINTIGSKANDTDIQHLVVNMKEELEKIKEQILNIV